MFNGCDFSNDSDCSYLFDGIPVYITALQALLAALLIMTSVPVNILLITSMIVYREMLDTSIILAISFLISNISVSVFLSGEIFLTSVARAWLFDYWGCQLIAFFILFGTSSCWILVGFLSLDRYCRVFYPFSYPRYDKKVNVILLMVSLVMCGVLFPMVHALANTVGFDITLPGCHVVSFEFTSAGATVVVSLITIVCGFFGGLLPTILYTLMYIKARRLRSAVYPELMVPDFGKLDAHKKSNRAAFTYFLTMVFINGVNCLAILKVAIEAGINNKSISPAVATALLYVVINVVQSYMIGDLVILLADKDQRKVFVKLLKRLYNQARESKCLNFVQER